MNGARSIGGVGGRCGIVVPESVTRRSAIDEEVGATGTGGWDDILGAGTDCTYRGSGGVVDAIVGVGSARGSTAGGSERRRRDSRSVGRALMQRNEAQARIHVRWSIISGKYDSKDVA